MRKKLVVTFLCLCLLAGCGRKNVSDTTTDSYKKNVTNDNGKTNSDSGENVMEKEDSEGDIIYNELIEDFLQIVKVNNYEKYLSDIPKELIDDEYYLNNINESCNTLFDVWKKQYGTINNIKYKVVEKNNYEINELRNDLQNDIDSIEDMSKGLKNLLEADCNIQKCLELTIDLYIDGTHKSEQRELKYFYVYQIDNQWYTDANALHKLKEYESEMEKYQQESKEAEKSGEAFEHRDIEY